jgi:predicted ATP-grasp superfamily ATP-dependent carboligase
VQSVLVTDGEQRSALAIARSLGGSGHTVYVCSSRKRSLAGASRFASADITVPDALTAPNEFAVALERLLREHDIDVLLPVTEAALLAALPARSSFPNVVIPFPDLETFRRVSDKAAVMDAACTVGVSIPRQTTLRAQKEREALDRTGLDFPLVLKPARSVAGHGGTRSKWGVCHAANWQELNSHLDQLPPHCYPLLLQQRIVGPGIGIFVLLWDGETIASFAHRRLREKPPAGGVSVYRESIAADPQLVKQSVGLLQRFGWQGVAMVEYKVEAESGTPYLMEINGRFWGSLQLAIDAGVDFPVLLLQCATGEIPHSLNSYRTGIRSRWWWGEVDHLLTRLRHSDDWLALPPNSPGRWLCLYEFLKLWRRGDRYEVLRLTDARPFWRETIDWFHGR